MQVRKINLKYLFILLAILFVPFYGISQTIYAEADANYDGIKRIEVEGRFSDVNIIGTDKDDVQFKGIIKGKLRGNKEFEIMHRQEGSVLKVWIEAPRSIIGRFEARMSFTAPHSIDIEITNSSGDIYIEDVVSEKMRLKTSSGDVQLKNIETNLTSVSTSGDLQIDYLKGSISVASTSGDQDFNHVRADISSRATSGDMSFFDVVGDISTKTTSGDLQFENIEGNVSNVSTSGNLTIRNAKTILDLLVTSGDIRGAGIELLGDSKFTSTSGNVSMDFENNIDEISFDLRASSGDLSAGDRSSEKKLYLRRGEVWIFGHSTSGDQTYR